LYFQQVKREKRRLLASRDGQSSSGGAQQQQHGRRDAGYIAIAAIGDETSFMKGDEH
jgi:hypothetical protein